MRRADGGDVVVATVSPASTQALLDGANDSDESYYVRAVNACDLVDRDPVGVDLKRAAFDGVGALILPTPGPVTGLLLRAGAGGEVFAQWGQVSRRGRGEPVASAYHVYIAFGSALIDYNTPALTLSANAARSQSVSIGTYDDRFVLRAVVRAVSGQGAEEANTTEASVIADAAAPLAVAALTMGVVPQ